LKEINRVRLGIILDSIFFNRFLALGANPRRTRVGEAWAHTSEHARRGGVAHGEVTE
jgi:hypothetical protein